MIQDLHSHTYYSFCGKDSPERIVEAAIEGGIQLFGFTDHAHGVGFCRHDARKAPIDVIPNKYPQRTLQRYFEHMTLIRDKYAGKIRILRGIEVATTTSLEKVILPDDADISFFDYCLLEHLDDETSCTKGDLFSFAKRCGCPAVGVAHTDLLSFIKKRGEDPLEYLSRMAEQNIFWEMNVSFDSIHKYHEHEYMLRFFESKEEQQLVRRSGVRLSIGFDGHRIEDYLPQRVQDYCKRVQDMGIKLVFED